MPSNTSNTFARRLCTASWTAAVVATLVLCAARTHGAPEVASGSSQDTPPVWWPVRLELEATSSPSSRIVAITAHLHNTSSHVVSVPDSMKALANIEVRVRKNGRPVAPTAHGRTLLAPERGSRSIRTRYIAPNGRRSYRLWIGALYDMSEAGTYTVQARYLLDSWTDRALSAPPLTVRVAPASVVSLEPRKPVAASKLAAALSSPKEKSPLKIELAATATTLASNRPMTILVRFRNTSNRPANAPDSSSALRLLRPQVLHGGKRASLTALGRKYLQPNSFVPRTVPLAPHGTITYRVALGALYDMTEAGAYTVLASLPARNTVLVKPLTIEVKNNPLVLGLPLAPTEAAAIQAHIEEMFKQSEAPAPNQPAPASTP